MKGILKNSGVNPASQIEKEANDDLYIQQLMQQVKDLNLDIQLVKEKSRSNQSLMGKNAKEDKEERL